ncbi:hypothetical protein HZB94_01525 [Candidatus Falkowbacteria bacterium]|nr:hypothetical protein [Candidatus Falkowbacteria bacterium]
MKNIGRKSLAGMVIALTLFWAGTAGAQDLAVNAGAIEVMAIPDEIHLGAYPYLGGSLVIPTKEVTLVPGLSVEWSPEFNRWGFVANLVLDRPLNDRIGLDLNLALTHDQEGNKWDEAVFLLGFGPGASIFLGQWTISPSFCFFRGLNVPGWTFVPGVNISYLF